MVDMDFDNPAVWILGSLALVATVVLIAPRWTKEARLERRRRKSNAPIVSKSRRPTVRFSVRTKKK
jgi:hypothetical protein